MSMGRPQGAEEGAGMFYSKWSPSPKSKSLLAQRAANDQPLFLRGLAGSPKAAKASPAHAKTDPAVQRPKDQKRKREKYSEKTTQKLLKNSQNS